MAIRSSTYPGPPTDFYLEVAAGRIPGMSAIQRFDRNLDLSAGVQADIWAGGQTRAHLNSAETLDVVSDSLNDDGVLDGTGAREVKIEGLDNNYAEISETVTLTGIVPVTTVNSYLRVHHVEVNAVGDGGENAGTITVDPTISKVPSRQAVIEPGSGVSQGTHFTIPAGKRGYLVGGQASIFAVAGAGARTCKLKLLTRPGAGQSWRGVKEVGLALQGAATEPDFNLAVPLPFTAESDIRFVGTADVNSTGVYVQYSLILEDV